RMFALARMLSLRHLKRHPVRTALVLAGIALGVAASTATRMLEQILDRSLRAAATPMAGEADLYVSNGDAGVHRTLLPRLAGVAGVRSVRPVVVQRVVLPGHEAGALLLGIDLAAAVAQRADLASSEVHALNFSPQAYLRATLLGRKPVVVGSALDATMPRGATEVAVLAGGSTHMLPRAGTIAAGGPLASLGGHMLIVDARVAAAMFCQPGRVSRLALTLAPTADRNEVRRQLERVLA